MNQGIVAVYISEGALLLFVVIALILLLLASAYDVHAIARRKSHRAIVRSLRRSRQPHITILVYAYNAADTIERSLGSIRKSRYHHTDVVVIDNGSTDQTRQRVKDYQKKYPHDEVVFYKKRILTSRLTALQQGYRRSKRGDIVCVIDGNNVIPPSLLKEGVAHFVTAKKLSALQFHLEHIRPLQFTTLLQQFLEFSEVFYRKSISLSQTARIAVGSTGTFYKASILKKGHIVSAVPCTYDYSLRARVLDSFGSSRIMTRPSSTVLRTCLAIFVIILLTYYIFIAASLESSSMLTLSWAAVSLWCLIAIWSDETKTVAHKVTLAFCAPLLYFLLYVQLITWVFRFYERILIYARSASRVSLI